MSRTANTNYIGLITKERQAVIKVTITAHELRHISADQEDMYVTAKLRAAGIPVIGLFKFKGLEYGNIISYTDIETDDKIIIWQNT